MTSPDNENAHFGQCDCCGKTRAIARTWMYGRMETWACVECTGGNIDSDYDEQAGGY